MINKLLQSPIILLLFSGFCLWAGFKIHKLREKWSGLRNNTRGKKGEHKAIKALQKRGFVLLDSSPVLRSHMFVDGLRKELRITPDILMEKDGEPWLIEVKTGNKANLQSETRRQVLEYQCFAPHHQTALYFADTSEFLPLQFSFLKKPPRNAFDDYEDVLEEKKRSPLLWVGVGLGAGLLSRFWF